MNVLFKKGSTTLVDLLTFMGAILFLVFLINGGLFLFVLSCFLLGLGLYPRFYLNVVRKGVRFINNRDQYDLTNGDQGEIILRFENTSFLPAMGTCQFSHNSVFKLLNQVASSDNKFSFPITILGRSSTETVLPIQTTTRGIGRLIHLTLVFSDPLKIMTINLQTEFVRKKIVSYPKKQPVGQLEHLQLLKEGQHIQPFSLFNDRSLTIGTRDYNQGDSLKAIHWKATARKGSLQTKLFEKTNSMTWSFVILIGSDMTKEKVMDFEAQLSSIARLIEIAHKKEVDFNLVVNTKPAGRSMILQTPFGHDRAHYFRMMERLATIQINFLRVAPTLAVRELTRDLLAPRVIFLTGDVAEVLGDPVLSRWMKRGNHLYSIEPSGAVAPVNRGGDRHAN